MTCFQPLIAWRGEVQVSGKRSVVFKSNAGLPALAPFPQRLPCSQCFGCRLDYSYDWAVRCVCEAKMHRENCLILLTYEDMPRDSSLQLADWQNFMKAVRREVGSVRYFHAGEYGTDNGRPHDHALLFGYDFKDRVFLKMSKAGFKLYTSKLLSKLWNKGHCSVGDMSFESAGYLARYLMEKPTLTRQVKDENGLVVGRVHTDRAVARYGERVVDGTGEVVLLKRPEYVSMSRRPGIGESWLRKYWSDIYPHDFVVLPSGSKMPPPRYFDNKVEEWKVVDMAAIKLHRMSRCTTKEEVWNKFLEKFQLLDVARDERLDVAEICKKAQMAIYSNERGVY